MTEGRTSLAGNRVIWVVVALFAASFLVRGAYLVAYTGVDSPLSGDEPDYHGIAASFLRGDGWTDPAGNLSYRPPHCSPSSFCCCTVSLGRTLSPRGGPWWPSPR